MRKQKMEIGERRNVGKRIEGDVSKRENVICVIYR